MKMAKFAASTKADREVKDAILAHEVEQTFAKAAKSSTCEEYTKKLLGSEETNLKDFEADVKNDGELSLIGQYFKPIFDGLEDANIESIHDMKVNDGELSLIGQYFKPIFDGLE